MGIDVSPVQQSPVQQSPVQSPIQSPVQAPVAPVAPSAVGGAASGPAVSPVQQSPVQQSPVQQSPVQAPTDAVTGATNCWCAPMPMPPAPKPPVASKPPVAPKPPVAAPKPPKPPVAPKPPKGSPKPPAEPKPGKPPVPPTTPDVPNGGPVQQSPVQQSPVQSPVQAPPAPPKPPKAPVAGGGAPADKSTVRLDNHDRNSQVKLTSSKGTSVEIHGDPHVTTVVNGTTHNYNIGYGAGSIKLSGGVTVSWNTYNNASHALLTFGIDAAGTKDDDRIRTDDGKDVKGRLTALNDTQLREFITKLAAYQGAWNKPLHK